MRRIGYIWERFLTVENLIIAAKKAEKHKSRKPAALHFHSHLEENIMKLYHELKEGSYLPGGYKKFYIYEPVKREISAAPFRDRVVHHAICNFLEPIYEPVFIKESFANQKGKGSMKAVDLCRFNLYKYSYALKFDVKKFFPSIDHEILKTILKRKIKDRKFLSLIELIIDSSNQQEEVREYFSGDSLFTPFERKKGIPIGNLTSQFFANVYLNPLDHFLKEKVGSNRYIRYVDDGILFSNSKTELQEWREEIHQFLDGYRLKLHPKKVMLFPTQKGVKFLGYRVFPNRIELNPENIRRFHKRRKRKIRQGQETLESFKLSMAGWYGYAGFSSSKTFPHKIIASTGF